MIKNKYVGTLVGCALGDTLGMPVEGWKKEQIEKYFSRITSPMSPKLIKDSSGATVNEDEFGRIKYYNKDLNVGDYTDDTILTLALAESILEKQGLDINNIAEKQLEAYESNAKHGGFGRTTTEGFKNLKCGISPLKSGVIGYPGNAPAMKMSPIGLYMHATGRYDEGIVSAENIGKITHLDPRSVASGIVQACAIYSILQGISRKEFIESMTNVCLKYEKPLNTTFASAHKGGLASRLEWIRDNADAEDATAFNYFGNSSFVYKSYPFAIFMFQKYWDDPINGLIETVNYGGDCDTTGAIFGSLSGAKNGIIFPNEWICVIKDIKKIKRIGEEMHKLNNIK